MGSIHQVRSCYSQFVSGWVLKLIRKGIRAFADMPWAAIDIHEKMCYFELDTDLWLC